MIQHSLKDFESQKQIIFAEPDVIENRVGDYPNQYYLDDAFIAPATILVRARS